MAACTCNFELCNDVQAASNDSADEDDDWEDKKIPTPRAAPSKKDASDKKKV